MEVRFLNVDGVWTRCLLAGERGRYPILMLHGYGGTADTWIRNIDALGQQYFVVAVDMLGAGFTKPAGPWGGVPQPKILNHLRGLIDLLGLERLCVMGSSYGSLIAALMYFDMPRRVNRLVLNGSGMCFNTDEQLLSGIRQTLTGFGPVLDAPTLEGYRTHAIKHFFDPSSFDESALMMKLTAAAQPWMKEVWESGLKALLDLDSWRDWAVRDRLHLMDVDTLVVWGRQDRAAILESAEHGVARMPRGKLIAYDNCKHNPMAEHPDKYNDMIRAFIGN